MGAWGPAIFSDDTACDVRDEYRTLIGDGLSGTAATDTILADWKQTLDDPEEGSVVWLALAMTQSKCGRLEGRVKTRALKIIESGTDLERWADDGKAKAKRSVALDKLRTQLEGPQPPERRIPKRFRDSCDWDVGELIGYRLISNQFVILRVVGHHTDQGGTMPVCELLDWIDSHLPDGTTFDDPGVWIPADAWNSATFSIGATSARQIPVDRIKRLENTQAPEGDANGGFTVFLWNELDQQLKECYGVE